MLLRSRHQRTMTDKYSCLQLVFCCIAHPRKTMMDFRLGADLDPDTDTSVKRKSFGVGMGGEDVHSFFRAS